jgi:hypothetical protein
MRYNTIIEIVKNHNSEAVIIDGFDQAIIGYTQSNPSFCIVYDIEKCISILVEFGMSLEDAVEYFDSNFLGAYIGENNPIFVSL